MSTYFLGDGVEPVADIGTSNLGYGLAEFTLCGLVIGQQLGQIVDSVEEADPAVITGLVKGDLFRCVVSAELEGLGKVGGIWFATHLGVEWGWDSGRHFFN